MINSFIPTSYLDRLLPNNIEAEEAVLGGLLLDASAINIIANKLPVEAFYSDVNQQVYRAIINLYKQQVHINLLSVADYLEKRKQLREVGVRNKLATLFNQVVSAVNIDALADLVLDKYIRRKMIEFGRDVMSQGYDDFGSINDLLRQVQQRTSEVINSFCLPEEDSHLSQYKKLIEVIREIELKAIDPGYREFKMQSLAKSWGKSVREIERMYFKSLIAEENEILMPLEEIRQKYGNEIREWLLHGFLPKGTTVLLHAKGGVGKTRLAYDFFYHLATGTGWSGFPVTAPSRRCLIVQTDEAPSDMLAALEDRGITDAMPIRYKTRWLVDHIQQLRKEIEDYRPEIVLIDSLTSVNRQSVFSENDTEYARPVLMLRDIAQEFGCTILIIHHSNSEGESRGTKAIFNSVSEVWGLKRDDSKSADGLERLLTIEKSRSRAPAQYRLRFDPEDKSWACLGKEGEDPNGPTVTTKQLIIDLLLNNLGTSYEAQEIHSIIGGAFDHVRRCCYQLAEDGILGRKKAIAPGRSYKHTFFIGSLSVDYTQRSPVDDHINDNLCDHLCDHLYNPEELSISAQCDHSAKEVITPHDQLESIEKLTISADSDPPFAKTALEKFSALSEKLQHRDQLSPEPLVDIEKKVGIGSDHPHAQSDQPPAQSEKLQHRDHLSLEPLVGLEKEMGIESDHPHAQSEKFQHHDHLSLKPLVGIEKEAGIESDHPPVNSRECPRTGLPLPQPFQVSVDGTMGTSSATITALKIRKDNRIEIRYDYKFANGDTHSKHEPVGGGRDAAKQLAYEEISRWEQLASHSQSADAPSSSSPAGDAIAPGDEVVPLVGPHKKKVLTVTAIDNAGIWAKDKKQGFSPAVGPFQSHQLKKRSGGE